MIISANIATQPSRMNSLKQMVASIYDQVDVIRICFNKMTIENVPDYLIQLSQFNNDRNTKGKIQMYFPSVNFTDNGKFLRLDDLMGSEYYFTMDDDLIYPPDYVQKTIDAIKKYGMIITYHGRTLTGIGKKYYYDHVMYRCLGNVNRDKKIDVCGTGVTAFDTRYFHPKGLADHKLKRMSDLTFSLEAAKQDKEIAVISHDTGWIRSIKHDDCIFNTESKKDTSDQNKLADEIYRLKHG